MHIPLDNHTQSKDFLEVERVVGDLLYLKGHPFPFKGLPTEERVQTTNILKGIFKLSPQSFYQAAQYVIQYDWAYRVRLLDLCNETTLEKLHTSPRAEIKRLMQINKERDLPEVHEKLNKFANLLRFLLLFPPFRRKFREIVTELPKMDESDRYWASMKTDYRFDK